MAVDWDNSYSDLFKSTKTLLVLQIHSWCTKNIIGESVCVCVDVTDIVNLNLLIPVRLLVVTRPPCSAPTQKNRAPVDKAQAPEETRWKRPTFMLSRLQSLAK